MNYYCLAYKVNTVSENASKVYTQKKLHQRHFPSKRNSLCPCKETAHNFADSKPERETVYIPGHLSAEWRSTWVHWKEHWCIETENHAPTCQHSRLQHLTIKNLTLLSHRQKTIKNHNTRVGYTTASKERNETIKRINRWKANTSTKTNFQCEYKVVMFNTHLFCAWFCSWVVYWVNMHIRSSLASSQW